MFTKSPFNMLDLFTATLIAFVIYLIVCVFLYSTNAIDVKIKKAVVYNDYDTGSIAYSVTPDHMGIVSLNKVSQNDIVEVFYEVVVKKQISFESERYLSYVNKDEQRHYLLSQTNNKFFDSKMVNTVRVIPVLFKIPFVAEKTCDYKLYSKNSVKYPFNIISYFRPKTVSTPPVNLCVS